MGLVIMLNPFFHMFMIFRYSRKWSWGVSSPVVILTLMLTTEPSKFLGGVGPGTAEE